MRDLPSGVEYLRSVDPILNLVIEEIGECKLIPHNPDFIFLVDSIISQQLSVKAASTIMKRVEDYFDCEITPGKIIESEPETLRSLGVSFQKIKYLKDLADKVLDKSISFEGIESLSNDEIVQTLTKVKGIGVWTTKMFLIFALGRLDVFPAEDLAFRNNIQKIYKIETIDMQREMNRLQSLWNPYQSIAAWYMWAWGDRK